MESLTKIRKIRTSAADTMYARDDDGMVIAAVTQGRTVVGEDGEGPKRCFVMQQEGEIYVEKWIKDTYLGRQDIDFLLIDQVLRKELEVNLPQSARRRM